MVEAVNPYCEIEGVLEELKAPANSAPEGSPARDKIQRAINDASRFVDEWCGRDFYLHDYSVTSLEIDEHDELSVDDKVWLPFGPVITLTTLTVADVEWTEDEDFVVKDEAAPVGSRRTVLVAINKTWSLARGSDRLLSITGKFGYDQATSATVPTGLPVLITRATRMIAALLTGDMKKEFVGLDGAKTDLIQTEIPKLAKDLLGSPANEVLV